MSTFKTYFSITCYSFTFFILIYNVLAKLTFFPPMTVDDIFIYFLMMFSITLLIAVTDLLPIRNQLLAALIRITDTVIVVFTAGLTFKLIPLTWTYMLTTIGMILLIYFGVSAVLMIKDKADAKSINEQLSRRLLKTRREGGVSDE